MQNGKELRRNRNLHESLTYLEKIEEGVSPDKLDSIYTELNTLYDELELKNDEYLAYCDAGDDTDEVEIGNANKMMENSYRNRCQLTMEISRATNQNMKY